MTEEKRKFILHDGRNGAAIAVHVTPRASQDGIFDIMEDGKVKIRLQAQDSPETVNQALLEFLAKLLGIPSKRMEIVAGRMCPDKLIAILDADPEYVQQTITNNLQ